MTRAFSAVILTATGAFIGTGRISLEMMLDSRALTVGCSVLLLAGAMLCWRYAADSVTELVPGTYGARRRLIGMLVSVGLLVVCLLACSVSFSLVAPKTDFPFRWTGAWSTVHWPPTVLLGSLAVCLSATSLYVSFYLGLDLDQVVRKLAG